MEPSAVVRDAPHKQWSKGKQASEPQLEKRPWPARLEPRVAPAWGPGGPWPPVGEGWPPPRRGNFSVSSGSCYVYDKICSPRQRPVAPTIYLILV
ncbi:hypothetical protein HOLleu_33313 [Holothuria leucospilota]|uniref:Uncharacterized protein n=1 Tax=Holothuria leucospilota TaxID=206669 RepID=A0A9Q0YQ33_HOLLE|nr:hypothetical protein HOLleu_33313 [Holothuria leucospilota]